MSLLALHTADAGPGSRGWCVTEGHVGAVLRGFPGRRRRATHEVVREHWPPARLVVFVLVVQRPLAVPGRHRHLTGSLVGPEPSSPALPVLLVPGLSLAVQIGRAG
jgi:hypothetical protein